MATSIIRLTDTEALAEAIRNAEGRATQRTLWPDLVERACDAAERALAALGVTKADRVGVVVEVNGSERLPSSYSYAADATYVQMRRARDGWRYESARRSTNRPRARDWQLVVLPSEEALLAGAKRQLTTTS